jgi:hypothetical protein
MNENERQLTDGSTRKRPTDKKNEAWLEGESITGEEKRSKSRGEVRRELTAVVFKLSGRSKSRNYRFD